jgi:hypothetical protein
MEESVAAFLIFLAGIAMGILISPGIREALGG